jgi:hypothetical protein
VEDKNRYFSLPHLSKRKKKIETRKLKALDSTRHVVVFLTSSSAVSMRGLAAADSFT